MKRYSSLLNQPREIKIVKRAVRPILVALNLFLVGCGGDSSYCEQCSRSCTNGYASCSESPAREKCTCANSAWPAPIAAQWDGAADASADQN